MPDWWLCALVRTLCSLFGLSVVLQGCMAHASWA